MRAQQITQNIITVDSMLSTAIATNMALALGGEDAARDMLIERGYSVGAANRVIDMSPTIGQFFSEDEQS